MERKSKMKKRITRILSMLLCLCMLVALLPTTVLAAETTYGLWVGSVQVTSSNANEITGDGISGNVSYNADTKTLTLDGATITSAHLTNDAFGIDTDNSFGDLTIELKNQNTIVGQERSDGYIGAGGSSYGMYIRGNLTLTGDGSLAVSSADATALNSWSVAILASGNITVNSGCTITATCGSAMNTAAPLYPYGGNELVLAGAEVTVASENADGSSPVTFDVRNLRNYKYLKIEPATTYTVTVTNGTASPNGAQAAGTAVTITANAPEAGKQFKEWTGADGLNFTSGSKTSATATFTMPAEAVAVTATYEDIPVAAAETPNITMQPVGATYTKGATAESLTVSASVTDGGTLSYQWKIIEGETNRDIEGATQSTYTPPTDTVGTFKYYCVVTNTLGDDNIADAVSDTVTITVTEVAVPVVPVYSISADTTTLDFSWAQVGYISLPSWQVITITNTGNQLITLTQPTATNYAISALSKTDLAAGETATFTVQPSSGLAVGTYNETITVQGANGGNSTNVINILAKFEVRSDEQQPKPQTYTVDVSADPAVGGNVSGGGTFEENTSVTVTATAQDGYKFVKWTENGSQVSTDASYTFTVTENCTLVAVFEEDGDDAPNPDPEPTPTPDPVPTPHSHSGGTATCKNKAVCAECGQPYGSKDSSNHTGGTEVRGYVAPTTTTMGYTGDTYCLGCNTKIATGTIIPTTDNENDDSDDDTSPASGAGDTTPTNETYTVQSGDTLWVIAKKYSCTVSEIVAANSELIKNPDLIHVGWQLKIPQAGASINTSDVILSDDKKNGTYIVKQGDTLWAISKKYDCTIAEIVALNGGLIINPDLIYAGWELKIPQD